MRKHLQIFWNGFQISSMNCEYLQRIVVYKNSISAIELQIYGTPANRLQNNTAKAKTLSLSIHTDDYSHRFRQQFVAENSDSRRFRWQCGQGFKLRVRGNQLWSYFWSIPSSNLCEKKQNIPECHRQPDRQTDGRHTVYSLTLITALWVASRRFRAVKVPRYVLVHSYV